MSQGSANFILGVRNSPNFKKKSKFVQVRRIPTPNLKANRIESNLNELELQANFRRIFGEFQKRISRTRATVPSFSSAPESTLLIIPRPRPYSGLCNVELFLLNSELQFVFWKFEVFCSQFFSHFLKEMETIQGLQPL